MAPGSRLEFEIQVEDGNGLLLLRPRTLFGWLRAERLELQIPNISFPLDISGGMAQFRAKRCTLMACALRVDSGGLHSLIEARAAPLAAAGFSLLSARADQSGFEIGGVARVGGESAELVARVRAHLRGRAVELEVSEVFLLGLLRRPAWLLAHDLLTVLVGAGVSEGEPLDEAAPLQLALGRVRLHPLDLFLARALPAAGWKVPAAERVKLTGVDLDGSGARLIWTSDGEALPSAPLIAAADSDAGDASLLRSDLAGAALAYRAVKSQAATDRLLSVLLAREATLREASEVAEAALGRWPNWPVALLALSAARARSNPATAADACAQALSTINEGGELSWRLARHTARLFELANPERAVEFHERVLSAHPDDAEAAAALLGHYQRRAEWPKLAALLEASIAGAKDPHEQARTLVTLSELYSAKLEDPERARAALESAAVLDEENASVWAALGRIHAASRDLPAAIAAYERLGALQASARTFAQIAGLREQLGELDRAQEDWRRALAAAPREAELWLRAATLAEKRADPKTAAAAWSELVALAPPLERFPVEAAARIELERARILMQRGEDFRASLRAAWKRAPSSPAGIESLRVLAEDARARGEPAVEAAWLDELLRVQPSAERSLRRGELHAAAGEWAQARERLAQAPSARRLYAEVLGHLNEHRAQADLLAELAADDPAIWIEVVEARLRGGDLDGAAAALTSAARNSPEDPAVKSAAAELAWQRHAWDEVAQLYPPLLQSSTGKTRARDLVRLGLALERLGAPDDARVFYREATALPEAAGEDSITAWRRLAELEERAGSYEAAAQAWSRAADDPRTDDAAGARAEKHRRAAELYHRRLGRSADAVAQLEAALGADAAHLPSLDLLESIQTELGNDEALAEILRKKLLALAGDPRRKELVRRLAELDSRRGDRDGALNAWQFVLEQDPTDPEAMRQLAQAALESRDTGAAAKRVVELPKSGLPVAERRELLIALGDLLSDARPEDAAPALAAALELEPPDRTALVEKRVRILLERLVDPVAALTAAREEWAQQPRDLRLLSLVAETAQAADEPAVRADALVRLLPTAASPAEWTNMVLEAAELYSTRLGDPARAQSLYEQVLHTDPARLPAGALKLAVHKARGRSDEVNLLRALHDAHGAGVDELERLAQLLGKSDPRAQAVALADALERHVEELASRGELLDDRGRALMADLSAAAAASSEYAALARGLARAAEVEPDPAAAASALGEAALLLRTQLDDWPGAADLLERALERRPDSALLLADSEVVLRRLDDSARLRRVYELHLPTLSGAARAPLLHKLADLATALGDENAASQHKSELVRWEAPRVNPSTPQSPDSGRSRALFLAVADAAHLPAQHPGLSGPELISAIAALKREIDLLPAREVEESRELRLRLAWMYRRAGELHAAHEEFSQLASEDPRDRTLWAALIETDLNDERWPEALTALERLQKLTDEPAERAALLCKMGEIYELHLGEEERAAEEYLRAVDLDPRAEAPLWRLVDYFWKRRDDVNLIDIARALQELGALKSPNPNKLTQARAWVALALDAFDAHRAGLQPPPELHDHLTAALGELAERPRPPNGLAAAARRLALASAVS